MHQLLSPADYRRMPWKNGGGRTLEIATEPPGAGTASFVWRVSVADIERDGPFSRFPGVDRTLVLLEGHGMRLTSDGGLLEMRAAFEPVRFPGESALHCALVDGPTRDFNLMVRRDAARGDVVVVRDAGCAIEPARCLVCFAATGACECLIAGFPPIAVPPGHALLIAADPGAAVPAVHVLPAAAGSVALVAVVRAPAAAQ
ncbi:MAG: HutD family protein [Burkholderiales bacterium]